MGRVRIADERARRVSGQLPTPIWPRCCARSSPGRSGDTRSSSAAPARSISSTCCCAPAICWSDHGQVRRAFQSRFTHLFVDEFQDTDPLQAEILLLLAADDPAERDWRRVTPVPGKLFLVGDPKQAIYRFRRADVETYQEVCDLLESRGAKRAYLHTSFRATPAIQHVVNAAFEPIMDGNRATLQAQYVGLSTHRPESTDQPSVVVLPVPEPYGQQRIAGYAIEKSLPTAVGAFVHWLLTASGWTITERTDARRAAHPHPDSAAPHLHPVPALSSITARTSTRGYVEALEARGVPHLLVGGKSFHDREEVETMRAALAAVEWPDDDVSVFATLRGALFAIDDESLFLYRHRHKSLHPFRIAEDPEFTAIVEALTLLRRLHNRRNYRPVADTITELLTATRAHVGFVLRNAGEQALANVLHVAELARQYEANGGISFRGFVETLNEQADGGQAAEAPILEEGTDGVRLMTTHKAKGLEFPVVVLADMTAKLKSDRADRLVDRSKNACYLRLGPMDADRAGDGGAGRDRPGRGGRRPRGVRGRDACAGSAGRTRGGRCGVGRWLGVAAERGHLPARRPPAFAGDRHGMSAVQEGLRLAAPGQRSFNLGDRVPGRYDSMPRPDHLRQARRSSRTSPGDAQTHRGRDARMSCLVGSACARPRGGAAAGHPARSVDREGRAGIGARRRPPGIREMAHAARDNDRVRIQALRFGPDRDRVGLDRIVGRIGDP